MFGQPRLEEQVAAHPEIRAIEIELSQGPRRVLLARGLDPSLRSVRVANPALVTPHQLESLDGRFGARTVADLLGGGARGARWEQEQSPAS